MTHIQYDQWEQPLCTNCHKPTCPVTGTNLAGVCWACVREWRRQMHLKAQQELREEAA